MAGRDEGRLHLLRHLPARDDPLYWPLRSGIRRLVVDHLGGQSKPLRPLLTDALAAGVAPDEARFGDICALARAARLVTVVLECSARAKCQALFDDPWA